MSAPPAEGFGEKVALVVGAELFSRFRERRTGNAAGQQIYALELLRREITHIPFHHIPVRTVQAKRLTGMAVKLHMR